MKKLYRVRNGKCIAGVCGGLAKYFDIEPKVIRLLFVLCVLIYSKSLIIYIILMIFMRKEPKNKIKLLENPLTGRQKIYE